MKTAELIDDYLARLATAARGLPADRRAELMDEIREHISVALEENPPEGEADVRNILDRLGPPEGIVREAAGGDTIAARRTPFLQSPGVAVVTVLLLLAGGIVVPLLGWLVGVVLLWAGGRWSTTDRLIGTLLWPGGLAPAAYVLLFATRSCVSGPGQPETCTGTPAWMMGPLFLGPALVVPVVVAGYLLRRAARAG